MGRKKKKKNLQNVRGSNTHLMGFPGGSVIKNPLANAGDVG